MSGQACDNKKNSNSHNSCKKFKKQALNVLNYNKALRKFRKNRGHKIVFLPNNLQTVTADAINLRCYKLT